MKTKIMSEVKKVQGLMMAVLIAFLMALFTPVVYAQAVHQSSDFNHMRTGFPLTGAHIKLECETCHVDGLFKGTPTNCAGCHSQGRRVVAPFKPATHMLTTAPCETCHTNTISFLGARFNHVGVQPKGCQTCHAGINAPSKPSGHIQTILSCDSCHRTSAWLPAGFDHTGIFEPCANCHNGSKALGKPANHITTSAACDSCHKSGFITFAGAIFDHIGAGVLRNTCISCHASGTNGAKMQVAGHIPTANIQCDICHVGTGFISFAGSTMNHPAVEAVPMNCSTCHNGSYTSQGSFLGGAKAKTANHVVTTAECGTCHLGRSSFLGGLFNHTTASPPVAGICQTCHNGVKALGKTNTVTHTTAPGNTASCDTCHTNTNNYTTFAGALFSHTGVVIGTCGTCHLGQTAAITKGSTHIPNSGNACDACHISGYAVGSFSSSTMNHSAVTAYTCATCHNGSYLSEKGSLGLGALAKIPNHIPTSSSCDSCHHSFTTFTGAVFDHAGVTPTTCGSCHIPGTGGAMQKGASHIPYTLNACDACHKAGYATGAFLSSSMNHAAVTSTRCDTCHNGSYTGEGTTGAQWKGSIANHIPTTITGTLDCNICHTSTTLWTSEKMNHNATTTGCKVCHNNGTTYKGNMTKMTLGSHQGSSTGDDCSKSSCHRPLGNIGTSWVNWN
jgi:hypothetical protein